MGNVVYVLSAPTQIGGKDVTIWGNGYRSVIQLDPNFNFSGTVGVIQASGLGRVILDSLTIDCNNRTGYPSGLPFLNMDNLATQGCLVRRCVFLNLKDVVAIRLRSQHNIIEGCIFKDGSNPAVIDPLNVAISIPDPGSGNTLIIGNVFNNCNAVRNTAGGCDIIGNIVYKQQANLVGFNHQGATTGSMTWTGNHIGSPSGQRNGPAFLIGGTSVLELVISSNFITNQDKAVYFNNPTQNNQSQWSVVDNTIDFCNEGIRIEEPGGSTTVLINIQGNTIRNCPNFGVQFMRRPADAGTAVFQNIYLSNNLYDIDGPPIVGFVNATVAFNAPRPHAGAHIGSTGALAAPVIIGKLTVDSHVILTRLTVRAVNSGANDSTWSVADSDASSGGNRIDAVLTANTQDATATGQVFIPAGTTLRLMAAALGAGRPSEVEVIAEYLVP